MMSEVPPMTHSIQITRSLAKCNMSSPSLQTANAKLPTSRIIILSLCDCSRTLAGAVVRYVEVLVEVVVASVGPTVATAVLAAASFFALK